MILIDSTYFGKFTFAPLNLIIYNVFTSHGPNLYGVEPISYYFINGFLNFNVIWLLAMVTPIMILLCHFYIPAKSRPTLYLPYYLSLSPFYAWLIVFCIQPHKEERFLFPIYPMVCLCGAISLDIIQKIYFRLKNWCLSKSAIGTHYLDHSLWIAAIVMIITTVFGLSRIYALYNNYHAPLDLMMELNVIARKNIDDSNSINIHNNLYSDAATTSTTTTTANYNVCVGKDWYRFPNSFFLPTDKYRIRFLKSEFNGMLPAYFTENENGTTIIHSHFNDRNKENVAMYFDYTKCHFLIDLDLERYTDLEPNYAGKLKDWIIIKSLPFLNTEKSHSIYRAFYVPFVSEKYIQYSDFYLLQRRRFKNV